MCFKWTLSRGLIIEIYYTFLSLKIPIDKLSRLSLIYKLFLHSLYSLPTVNYNKIAQARNSFVMLEIQSQNDEQRFQNVTSSQRAQKPLEKRAISLDFNGNLRVVVLLVLVKDWYGYHNNMFNRFRSEEAVYHYYNDSYPKALHFHCACGSCEKERAVIRHFYPKKKTRKKERKRESNQIQPNKQASQQLIKFELSVSLSFSCHTEELLYTYECLLILKCKCLYTYLIFANAHVHIQFHSNGRKRVADHSINRRKSDGFNCTHARLFSIIVFCFFFFWYCCCFMLSSWLESNPFGKR